jgi:sulfite reductase alpha subunit-like flavoprotein
VLGLRLTLVELLGQFQSVSVTLDQLANLLPRMGPR